MTNEPDTSILRWGGLAGIGGGVLFLFVFAWVILLAGPEPAGVAGPITRFPEIRAVRTVENGLYLAVLLAWVPVHLALHRRLGRSRPAAALVGSALGILGLGVLAAGAVPHAATSRLADLYHAAGASAEDRAMLALVWQGTQGIFDALVLTGVLVMATGIVLLGLAMRADAGFGRSSTWLSLLLGTTGLVAGTLGLVDPSSPTVALGVLALIGFHLALGWRLWRLSGVTSSAPGRRAEPGTPTPVR